MIYLLTKVVLFIFLKLFFRFSVRGRHNLGVGPTVLVANHTSYLDPVVVGVASSRPVYFMAKEELFGVPFLGWYIKQLHAFPVKRENLDRKVLRTAIGHLKRNRAVLVFPEGRRNRGAELAEALNGAAFIAYKAGAKIVPVAIKGTSEVRPPGSRFVRFPKISVRFGEPIELAGSGDKKAIMSRATETMMREIGSMLEEAGA